MSTLSASSPFFFSLLLLLRLLLEDDDDDDDEEEEDGDNDNGKVGLAGHEQIIYTQPISEPHGSCFQQH